MGHALDTAFAAERLSTSNASTSAEEVRRRDTELAEQTLRAVCLRNLGPHDFKLWDLGRDQGSKTDDSVARNNNGTRIQVLDESSVAQAYGAENTNYDSENQPTLERLRANFEHTRRYFEERLTGNELPWTMKEIWRAEGTASLLANGKLEGMSEAEWEELKSLERQVDAWCPSASVADNCCESTVDAKGSTVSCEEIER
jgi:hypothetical protein